MTTFTWQVVPTALENSGDMKNVIKKLSLNLICDGEPEIRRIKNAFVELNTPNADSFIDYSQLTEQQVLDWGLEQLGPERIDEMKAALIKEVDMVRNSATAAQDQPQQIVPPWITVGE